MVRKVAGNYYLFSDDVGSETGVPLYLNDTGYFIYEELQKKSTKAEIAKKLSEEYGVNYEDALSDVMLYAKKLSEYTK